MGIMKNSPKLLLQSCYREECIQGCHLRVLLLRIHPSSEVNFIKILRESLTLAVPKSAKKYSQAVSLFALFGYECVKTLR